MTASSSSSKVARRPVTTVTPSVGTRPQQTRSSSRPPISTCTAPTTQLRQSTAQIHNGTTTEATRQQMLINVASKRSRKSISSSSILPLLFQLERNYLAFLSWQQEWGATRASTAARNDPRPVLLALVQDFFHSHNQNRIKQQRQAAQPLSGNPSLLTMTCTCAEGLWYSAPPETLAVDQSLRSLTDKLAPSVNRQNQKHSAASQDLPLVGDVLRALSSHYLLRTTEKSAHAGDNDCVNDTTSWLVTMLGRYLQQEITQAISSPCAMVHAAGLFPSCDYCRTAAELMRLCRAFPAASPRLHCSAQVEWYCFLTTVLLRTLSSTTSFDSQLLLDLPCSVLVKFFDQQFLKCDRTVPDTVPQRSLYIRLLYRVGRAAQKWLAMPVSGAVAPSRPRLSQKLSTAYTQWMKERLSTFATSALSPSSSSSPSLHSVPHYVLVMQRNLDLGNEVVTTTQFHEALAALQKRVLTAAPPSVAASKRSVGALPTTQQNLQRKGAVATVARRRPPAKRRRRQDTSSDESEEVETTSSSSSESEDDEEERPVADRHLQKTTTTTAPPAKKPRTTGPTRTSSPKVLSEDETLAAVFAKGTPLRAQRKK